jgi:2-phosphosulfolactate phosphatase
MDWGRSGAQRAADRDDILVIVDVLSFSTAVATALHYGGLIYPCTHADDPAEIAGRIGGEVAVFRAEVPAKGRFSLSPLTYLNIESGKKVVVASPNGATCSILANKAPYVFTAGLVNSGAVGERVTEIIRGSELSVTVIACGEREKGPDENGPIRWASEDYLGAGSVISHIPFEKSPDAVVCESAFKACQGALDQIIWNCPSGLELRDIGFGEDIRHSSRMNIYDCVPVIRNGCFRSFSE